MTANHDDLARAIIDDSTGQTACAVTSFDVAIERAQSVVASLQDSIRLAQALSDEIAREASAQRESQARQSEALHACVEIARSLRAAADSTQTASPVK